MNDIRMMTKKECSEKTGLSVWTISRLLESGQIRFIKSGRKTFVNYQSLLRYLGENINDEKAN